LVSFKYIVDGIKTLTIVGLVALAATPYYHKYNDITVQQNLQNAVYIENGVFRKNPETGQMEAGVQLGAGVLVNNQYVITVRHLLNQNEGSDGKNDLTVVTKDGVQHKAVVYGLPDNNDLDLVILKMDDTTDVPLTTRFSCQTPSAGEEVYTIGSPEGFENMITYGHVAMGAIPYPTESKDPEIMKLIKTDFRYVINMASFHGNSGGAVYGSDGKVFGLVDAILYWTDEFGKHPAPITYVMAPSDMCALMNKFHVTYKQ
jgi:S1-C subfamily serine protease